MDQRSFRKSHSKANNSVVHFSISNPIQISSTNNKINSNSSYSFGSAFNITSNKSLCSILLDFNFQSEEVMHYSYFAQLWSVCNRAIFHTQLLRHDFEICTSDMVHSANRPNNYYKRDLIKRKWTFCHDWKFKIQN
jgi:hypothetical protein